METYICKECNQESKEKIVWADKMTIEGTLYFVEESECEHCGKVSMSRKIQLT